jgi:ATP-binding cassette, subfamily B, bacterial PglK
MKAMLGIIRRLFAVLPAGSKRFLGVYGGVMAILSLVDVVALGALAIALPGLIDPRSAITVPVIGWTIDSFEEQVVLIGLFALLIAAKSLLNIIAIRVATRKFARHETDLGQTLFTSYMSAPWVDRLSKNTQEIIRMVDSGVAATVSGVLMPSAMLVGDVVTMIVIGVVLFVADWQTAIVTLVYLSLLAYVLGRVIAPRALVNGTTNRVNSNRIVHLLQEILSALKEITLKGNEHQVERAVRSLREPTSQVRADVQFYRQVPRFVLETGLVVGFLVVGVSGFVSGGQVNAITSVALFAVAGFRLVPALTRFQSTQNQILTSGAFADQVVKDISFARDAVARREAADTDRLEPGLHDVTLQDVTFTYPNRTEPALRGVSLRIPAGSRVAVVGSSGAGKSTLIDLLLGLLTPDSGRILIDDKDMTTVLRQWRSNVGYVPQDVALFDLPVSQNVALTWEPSDVDEERVRGALERAQMLDVVEARPGGLSGTIGERGMGLSGGQRQRLGIARGLYAGPSVLVLDEATSALDTATEAAVTRAIRELAGDVTTITIAHRLATIRDSDTVFYLADGRLVAHGTFDQVVAEVPDFAQQASLAGLVESAEALVGDDEEPIDPPKGDLL